MPGCPAVIEDARVAAIAAAVRSSSKIRSPRCRRSPLPASGPLRSFSTLVSGRRTALGRLRVPRPAGPLPLHARGSAPGHGGEGDPLASARATVAYVGRRRTDVRKGPLTASRAPGPDAGQLILSGVRQRCVAQTPCARRLNTPWPPSAIGRLPVPASTSRVQAQSSLPLPSIDAQVNDTSSRSPAATWKLAATNFDPVVSMPPPRRLGSGATDTGWGSPARLKSARPQPRAPVLPRLRP